MISKKKYYHTNHYHDNYMHKHNTELSPSYITVMSDQYQKSCRQKNLGKQIICKQMGESLAKIDKM